MASFSWATALFLLGYAIASIVGFASRFVSETMTWLNIVIATPCFSGFLAHDYMAKTRCAGPAARREMARLLGYWICRSFGLDASTYIGIMPKASGAAPNRHFLVDPSPWNEPSTLVPVASGTAAVLAYQRRQPVPIT